MPGYRALFKEDYPELFEEEKQMNMTPKKILSIPVYGTGITVGWLGLLLILPGGLLILTGLGLSWLADKLSADKFYECDMTVEEYEDAINSIYEEGKEPEEGIEIGTPKRCDNCTFGDACLTAADHVCTDWESEVDIDG